jgi:prepilin-type N-terminal cleavage/methylation domain-containing protein
MQQQVMQHRRSGFTLVELLVVISVLLILSVLVFAVFNTGRSSERMRSAARVAQSAFLGAKDRALHAKDLRGVRLTRDLTSPALVSGFVFLQPMPLQTAGNNATLHPDNISVLRPNTGTGNFDATNIEVKGAQGAAWFAQDQSGIWPATSVRIRVPAATGSWYVLSRLNNAPPYWGMIDDNDRLNFFLQSGVQGTDIPPPSEIAIDYPSGNASCDIQLGNDLLPFHQPISLSSGVIIDLSYSSTNVQTLATSANIDVMFSPRGNVSGYVGGLGPMHFLFRSLKDATAGRNPWAVGQTGSANPDLNEDDRMILTVLPQTGLVQAFEIDPTDLYTNPSTTTPISYPGTGSPDGIADNLFNFAQKGKAAGR